MFKKFLVLGLVLILTLAIASPAFAHTAPPCNDFNSDGSPSGHEYAQHHIRPLATSGALGFGGHVPGVHQGFSVCNP